MLRCFCLSTLLLSGCLPAAFERASWLPASAYVALSGATTSDTLHAGGQPTERGASGATKAWSALLVATWRPALEPPFQRPTADFEALGLPFDFEPGSGSGLSPELSPTVLP